MIKQKLKNFKCLWSGHRFEAIESFKYRTNLFYNKVIVYRCSRCEKLIYSDVWAFMVGAGALDYRYPKHEEYRGMGNYIKRKSEDEYIKMVLTMLSKYFVVEGNRIYGIRIS